MLVYLRINGFGSLERSFLTDSKTMPYEKKTLHLFIARSFAVTGSIKANLGPNVSNSEKEFRKM